MKQLVLRHSWLGLAAAAALLVAGTANAEKFEYMGSHTVRFSNLGHIVVTGTGTGLATVNGSGGGGHLDSLEITQPFASINTVVPITDPIVTQGGIVEVRLTGVALHPPGAGGAGGLFAPISGALANTSLQLTQNTLPSTGLVRICLVYAGCNSGSLDQNLGQTVNGVFVGPGVGGLITIGGAGSIRISIVGAPWTVKTVSVSNRTDNGGLTHFGAHGFAHGPASLTSSTALTSGVVQLVTANQTNVVGVPGNQDLAGQITELKVFFTPEPGLLLLLASGGAGLAILGFRRRRK